jgi:hypothetical protein
MTRESEVKSPFGELYNLTSRCSFWDHESKLTHVSVKNLSSVISRIKKKIKQIYLLGTLADI